jgi:putative oxidoreductase
MFWAVLLARVVLGFPFFVFGLNYFLHFMPMPPSPATDSPAAQFSGLLVSSGYMNAVKVFEITGGALLLSGRLVPLGLTLLTPVAVNILFFEIFLLGKAGPGVALVVLCMLLIWAYRSHFAAVFAVKPKIG